MGALETLRRREWTIAWVRWAIAVLAAGQLLIGGQQLVGLSIAMVALLTAISLAVAVADRRLATAAAWRRASALFMGTDVVGVFGLVAAGVLEGNDEGWFLLALVTLEGALRYRMGGALLVALGSSISYAALSVLVDLPTSTGVLVLRVAFLGVIGAVSGAIARELDQERQLYLRVAEAAQDIVARRDTSSILSAVAHHVGTVLDARQVVIHLHDLHGWSTVATDNHGAPPTPLLDDEDAASAVLHRLTWRSSGRGRSRLTLPIRLPERPAEYVVVAELTGPRPTAVAEGALLSLAESTAVSLATRDLIRSQEASNRRLERLEALRTRFVATVAHDLRSPLTTVKGVARILRGRRDSVPPERVDQMLASVERQANRLNRLADDLLDAARLDSDQLELSFDWVSLHDVLDAVVADAADEVQLLDTPDVQVWADGPRLERIVWNLVTNALKYGRAPVELQGRLEDDHVQVRVRDHGRGLTAEQVENLFADFASGSDPDSVGLGLAIVWELTAAHDGKVEYRDAGPGAEFLVTIPARQ